MTTDPKSGQAPFVFSPQADLTFLPAAAREHEVNLHGGFAVDNRPGFGQIYYGMSGLGVMRVEADLRQQAAIQLPDNLRPLNFHSTKNGQFDVKMRLFMPADSAAHGVVVIPEGARQFWCTS